MCVQVWKFIIVGRMEKGIERLSLQHNGFSNDSSSKQFYSRKPIDRLFIKKREGELLM